MGQLQWLGVLSPAQIKTFSLFSGGKKIGTDQFGNKYYEGKPRKGYKLARRWVIYKDKPEASYVPPEWHGWLHHQSDHIPTAEDKSFRREWQKPHTPNQTGTTAAYRPPGHLLKGGTREKASGDYQAWSPPE